MLTWQTWILTAVAVTTLPLYLRIIYLLIRYRILLTVFDDTFVYFVPCFVNGTLEVLYCLKLTVIVMNLTHENYQRFSIGFKSGVFEGQSIVFTLLIFRQVSVLLVAWIVALSSWKVKLTSGNVGDTGLDDVLRHLDTSMPQVLRIPTMLIVHSTQFTKLSFFTTIQLARSSTTLLCTIFFLVTQEIHNSLSGAPDDICNPFHRGCIDIIGFISYYTCFNMRGFDELKPFYWSMNNSFFVPWSYMQTYLFQYGRIIGVVLISIQRCSIVSFPTSKFNQIIMNELEDYRNGITYLSRGYQLKL
uniref:G protein-coupled receptor n=1 Tax=Heterorhabditis bacteriophora TaxID=37862 RepID=A0A1I7XF70_HETBA